MDNRFHKLPVNDTQVEIPRRYENLRRIGSGAQGHVFSAYDRVTNRSVAIKKLTNPLSNVVSAKRAYREFVILNLVNHRNVIKLLNAYTPQGNLADFSDIYLVMECMESNLYPAIKNNLDHEQISYLLYQLLCGIHHLHKAGIIHRDLKPGNIAIDRQCQLKILDFGLARMSEDFSMTSYVVTRYYRAPEIILEMGYDSKVDVWSIGCIFAEVVVKQILFPGRDTTDQWDKIIEKVGSPSPAFIERLQPAFQYYVRSRPAFRATSWTVLFPDSRFPRITEPTLTPASARDLLSKMLVVDPKDRIDVHTALSHPYVIGWYTSDEVQAPAPGVYDNQVEETDHSVDQWKTLIFEKIKEYEATHDVFGSNGNNAVPGNSP